jgi:hypothetical protein
LPTRAFRLRHLGKFAADFGFRVNPDLASAIRNLSDRLELSLITCGSIRYSFDCF